MWIKSKERPSQTPKSDSISLVLTSVERSGASKPMGCFFFLGVQMAFSRVVLYFFLRLFVGFVLRFSNFFLGCLVLCFFFLLFSKPIAGYLVGDAAWPPL